MRAALALGGGASRPPDPGGGGRRPPVGGFDLDIRHLKWTIRHKARCVRASYERHGQREAARTTAAEEGGRGAAAGGPGLAFEGRAVGGRAGGELDGDLLPDLDAEV